jgi:hypothetical protein
VSFHRFPPPEIPADFGGRHKFPAPTQPAEKFTDLAPTQSAKFLILLQDAIRSSAP